MYYNNYSSGYNWDEGMSNRAVEAYDNGAMPLSKWTKSTLIEGIISTNFENGIDDDLKKLLQKHSMNFLKENFLSYDSWHHTGKCYNRTEFFSIINVGEEEATSLILKEEIRIPKEKEKKTLSKPAKAFWVEFYKHGTRWKTEDITSFGKIKDGWFYGLDNSKKKLTGKHLNYIIIEEIELKREYRKKNGTLKGFKAWMEN